MEQIKVMIKTVFELLIMAGCVLLVFGVFFFAETDYGIGIWGKTGTTFAPLIGNDLLANEGAGHLEGHADGYIPELSYSQGSLRVGDEVKFKQLLSAKLENGIMVNGAIESGFAIYLQDIQTKNRNSVLEKMSTDELENMEEIPSAFVYDKEMDMLYVFASGTYTVMVKIYSEDGAMKNYEFQLPVEISQ